MLRRRLYYSIKPLVPWSVRLAIRRWFALRKRRHVSGAWPILPGSEKPPAGWSGWPHGKQFAFVLTHDVEGQGGVDKCRQLMALEDRLGFRSSFNFIPEGEYRVSRELRGELTSNGFEVGVHDLHHDGKLYRSRGAFSQKAHCINQYLKEWGAVGFRSGFMLHNLDWLGDLDVLYDASTFDTDAFEPQPDGVGTIFPFWIRRQGARAHCSGYVEMPYTLPQDSTLFLVLQERHPDVWFQKLDWVARHGGMALLNLHPDYVCFDGRSPDRNEFSSAHYIDLLKYVQSRYGGAFWHALPKTVAETFRDSIRPADHSIAARGEELAGIQRPSIVSGPRL
jgi:hypothetical protein